ncbi:MAG: hypothetical protein WC447_00355 [Candidatus Paceibacterota bacterium]|jgi:hypothetical protein
MSKINNNLILIFGILAFIFGLSLASPAFARGGVVESGVTFTPYTYPVEYISNPVNNGPVVIPGCEGRNTGYSTVNGQSCVGNYIAPTTTATKTTVAKKTTNTTVAKTTTPAKVATASDINESYGDLTANALFGSDSFMPSGLIQWIIAIVLVLAIIFLWRYVHRSKENYMLEPMKHA